MKIKRMNKKIKIIIIIVSLSLLFFSSYLILKEVCSNKKNAESILYKIPLDDFIEGKDIPCLIKDKSYPCENENR